MMEFTLKSGSNPEDAPATTEQLTKNGGPPMLLLQAAHLALNFLIWELCIHVVGMLAHPHMIMGPQKVTDSRQVFPLM